MAKASTALRPPPWGVIAKYDLPASLVVFLVALPLSLGIAIASNAPIMAGLISAIVGGIVAGIFGGSPLQVSGPAAGLTVIIAELVNNIGWKATCLVTVLAGVIQIILGLSRVARLALMIAPVVVHAMLAGIGVTIVLQQLHVLLGGSPNSTAWENLSGLPRQIADLRWHHLLAGVIVMAIMLSWRYLPKGIQKVPGALVAVVVGTVAAIVFNLDVTRIELNGSLFDALSIPSLPANDKWTAVIIGAFTVAIIASVESLLSAVAVDKMHNGPRTNFDRELVGQGAANLVSGGIGGIPVTGVIVRSSTNVASGARTRASAILHGIWILIFAVLLTGLVQQIPKSVLAGLLIVIGIQLVKLAHIKHARKTGDLVVYIVTLVCVVFLNLLEGVAIGLALALALILWRVVRASIEVEKLGEESSPQWKISILGSATFLTVPRLTKVLQEIPSGSDVTVHIHADFIDQAVSETINSWRTQHESTGGAVTIEGTGSTHLAAAEQAPPVRRFHTPNTPHPGAKHGLAPWKSWQGRADHDMETAPSLRGIKAGIDTFHKESAPLLRPHLDELVAKQSPDALFLTCADSRIVPNVITSSGPGDLFTVRNVGNIIPTSDDPSPSVEASLTYAIEELGVTSVIVCGHSGCGAMAATLDGMGAPGRDFTHSPVDAWLRHAQRSLQSFRAGHPAGRAAAEAGFNENDQLSIVNVATQLETLARHSLVGKAASEGRLRIFGMWFDIATARVIEVTTHGITIPDHPVDDPNKALITSQVSQ